VVPVRPAGPTGAMPRAPALGHPDAAAPAESLWSLARRRGPSPGLPARRARADKSVK
jgi:hypothetical protein